MRDRPCGTRAVSLVTLITQMLECMLAGASKGGRWPDEGVLGPQGHRRSVSRPNLCRGAPTASASGGMAGGAGSGPDSLRAPGAAAGATPGLWRMDTLGLSPSPVLTQSWGREGAPTRPRGGRALQGLSWHPGCTCAPSGLLGPFAALQEGSACRGPGLRLPATYGCSNQVVTRPPQRGDGAAAGPLASSAALCSDLWPRMGVRGPRGRGWKARGLTGSHRLALCGTRKVPEASGQRPAAQTPR